MSKYVKDLLSKELHDRYDTLDSVLWIDMTGAGGVVTNRFRADLHSKQMRAEIVRNSLFKRACGDGPLASLADALSGPCMLVTGGDSLIDVAKAVDEWALKIPSMSLRGAVLEGEYIGEDRVADLSKMLSKSELQAKIASIVLSPGGNLAAAVLAGGSNIAGCLKTLIEKLEKEGGDAAPEAADAPADQTPAETAPASEAPAAEAPAADAPADQTPAATAPTSEAPTAEAPAAEKPADGGEAPETKDT